MTISGAWSQQDATRAAALWQAHIANHFDEDAVPRHARDRVFRLIATTLNRSFENVYIRHRHFGPSFATPRQQSGAATGRALAELAARKAAESRHSLIGAVMGDPPPGFSALDRKRKVMV